MNLSLRNRVQTSFALAAGVVVILIFLVFHHLNSLNKEIESITVKSNKVSFTVEQMRMSSVSLLK